MKKISCLIIALFMLAMSTFTASAIDSDEKYFDIKMTADKTEVMPGDTFTVSIFATNITAPHGIIALDITLELEGDFITAVSKEAVFPAKWGTDGADFSWSAPKLDENTNKTIWKFTLLNDCDYNQENLDIEVHDDENLGIKLTFRVNEGAVGVQTLNIPTNITLSATHGFDFTTKEGTESLHGVGTSLNIYCGGVEHSEASTETSAVASEVSAASESAESTVVSNVSEASEQTSGASDDGMSTQTIVIIVVGVGAVVAVAIILSLIFKRKKQ